VFATPTTPAPAVPAEKERGAADTAKLTASAPRPPPTDTPREKARFPLLRGEPPAAVEPPASPLQSGAARERQLREAIVAHEPEMKKCVDRQLKLLPTLRAEGTLVIEVDARGRVPGAQVKGAQLEGTPLESCLRDAALRWRFPSNGRAYAVEAPLRVSGVDAPRVSQQ
jgi:hypothetical protein